MVMDAKARSRQLIGILLGLGFPFDHHARDLSAVRAFCYINMIDER